MSELVKSIIESRGENGTNLVERKIDGSSIIAVMEDDEIEIRCNIHSGCWKDPSRDTEDYLYKVIPESGPLEGGLFLTCESCARRLDCDPEENETVSKDKLLDKLEAELREQGYEVEE